MREIKATIVKIVVPVISAFLVFSLASIWDNFISGYASARELSNLDKRVIKIENDYKYIKSNQAEIKSDQKIISKDIKEILKRLK